MSWRLTLSGRSNLLCDIVPIMVSQRSCDVLAVPTGPSIRTSLQPPSDIVSPLQLEASMTTNP